MASNDLDTKLMGVVVATMFRGKVKFVVDWYH